MRSFKLSALIFLLGALLFNSCNNTKKQEGPEKEKTQPAGTVEPKKYDPLPSWNDTKSKERIISFVKSVTSPGNDFIPPEDRIATFDNDGTLWSEQPTYFQVEFVLYRIKEMAPDHPEWKKNKLIQAAINHDLKKLREKYGARGLGQLMAITMAGISTDELNILINTWMKNARHPVTGKSYSKMTFQPMLELIKYLQANNFKVYIVTGGGIDFMRAWATEVYGIQPENIIGSYSGLKYEKKNGKPVLIKEAKIIIINDGPEKAKNIHRFIGKKPVVAFGNSDGDLQMLEWCAANKYKNLPAFIHHTDNKREWAYDRDSRIGTLNGGLDEATKNKWLVVDMKKDWKVIHP
ncbi:MAG: haloacid dehalogenase-like hydrolase [Chlorobi bacterium]|nr:haloacid dehalogenase-like hydrolase [Chlorobiota bacterium]